MTKENSPVKRVKTKNVAWLNILTIYDHSEKSRPLLWTNKLLSLFVRSPPDTFAADILRLASLLSPLFILKYLHLAEILPLSPSQLRGGYHAALKWFQEQHGSYFVSMMTQTVLDKCQILVFCIPLVLIKKTLLSLFFLIKIDIFLWGCEDCRSTIAIKFDQGDSFCVVKSPSDGKNTAETCLNTSQPWEGLKKNIHNPEDKHSKVTITESNLSASSANTNTNTHAHTCIINAFHFKVLPIFWWHSHSSRVKQHLAASISIIKYFKQHPASTSVTPSRPMQLSFLSESVSICICHPRTHLRVINRCVRMQNNWCSLGRDWMGLSGAFNQCIFSL